MAGSRNKSLQGMKVNRLTVLERIEGRTNGGHAQWRCLCDCGAEVIVRSTKLLSGIAKSCGCLRSADSMIRHRLRQEAAIGTRHGHAGDSEHTRAYSSWLNMRARCTNPNQKDYQRYGGRGITVCERWSVFQNFLNDMGEPPDGYTIERKDRNGNYEPSNCHWVDRRVQANNRSSNRLLTHDGITLTAVQWAEQLGVSPALIYNRLRLGWSDTDALTRPVRRKST